MLSVRNSHVSEERVLEVFEMWVIIFKILDLFVYFLLWGVCVCVYMCVMCMVCVCFHPGNAKLTREWDTNKKLLKSKTQHANNVFNFYSHFLTNIWKLLLLAEAISFFGLIKVKKKNPCMFKSISNFKGQYSLGVGLVLASSWVNWLCNESLAVPNQNFVGQVHLQSSNRMTFHLA